MHTNAQRPMIMTFTGKHVDLFDLTHDNIDIRDIAHALSLANRFAGHSEKALNVAQHSVYVSRLCHGDRRIALQGLLHDAAEAYLGDVTKWLKQSPMFDGYRKLENWIQALIFRRFGVPDEQHPLVSEADKLMLRFEGPIAFGRNWSAWSDRINYPPITETERARVGNWAHWKARGAEEAFLTEFRLLTEEGGTYGSAVG